MRKTTRMLAGAVLAAGLGLTGCGEDDTPALEEGTTVDEQFDTPEGGDEDPNTVDRGTGGIQEDEEAGIDDGTTFGDEEAGIDEGTSSEDQSGIGSAD